METGELLLVLGAVSLGYFAKGVTGLGGPALSIPVLASFMGVEYAVAVIAFPTALANIMLVTETRAAASETRWFLVPMLVAGLLGTMVGVWLLLSIDADIMSVLLGVFMLGYIVWYLFNPDRKLSRRAASRLAAPAGLAAGALQGSTGISAPVVATYAHSLHLPRASFVFAISLPFLVLGLTQIVSLVALGGYDRDRVIAGLLASALVLVITPVAMRVGRNLSVEVFQYVVLAVLGLAALRLLWSGIA